MVPRSRERVITVKRSQIGLIRGAELGVRKSDRGGTRGDVSSNKTEAIERNGGSNMAAAIGEVAETGVLGHAFGRQLRDDGGLLRAGFKLAVRSSRRFGVG